MKVKLSDIDVGSGTQLRVSLDPTVISEYSQSIREGRVLPPVTVFDTGKLVLVDGFHRYAAYDLLGIEYIEIECIKGTLREAILYSCGANSTHGLKRSNLDKRNAVLTLLKDSEWSKLSDSKIAGLCSVSQPFVSGVRSDLKESEERKLRVERLKEDSEKKESEQLTDKEREMIKESISKGLSSEPLPEPLRDSPVTFSYHLKKPKEKFSVIIPFDLRQKLISLGTGMSVKELIIKILNEYADQK